MVRMDDVRGLWGLEKGSGPEVAGKVLLQPEFSGREDPGGSKVPPTPPFPPSLTSLLLPPSCQLSDPFSVILATLAWHQGPSPAT